MTDRFDEIAHKAPSWSSTAVNAHLRSAFGDEHFASAAILIAGLAPAPDCDPEADETACRLMLAAIKLSAGDLARLQLWVAAARQDPRDLIAAAEYSREMQFGTHEARDADLADYLAWVHSAGSAPSACSEPVG